MKIYLIHHLFGIKKKHHKKVQFIVAFPALLTIHDPVLVHSARL